MRISVWWPPPAFPKASPRTKRFVPTAGSSARTIKVEVSQAEAVVLVQEMVRPEWAVVRPGPEVVPRPVPQREVFDLVNKNVMNQTVYKLLICGVMSLCGCATTSPMAFALRPKQDTESVERVLSMARLMERQAKYDEALKLYQKSLDRDPKNATAWHRLGCLAVRRGDQKEALVYFARSAQFGTESVELLNDIGYALYLQNELVSAEEKLRTALKQNPQYAEARNNLGLVLAEQKRFDEALAEFRKAGDEASAHSNLAFVQTKVGALDEAEKNYHRALELNPKQVQAGQALVHFFLARNKAEAAIARIEKTETHTVSSVPQPIPAPVPALVPVRPSLPAPIPAPASLATSKIMLVPPMSAPASPIVQASAIETEEVGSDFKMPIVRDARD